jgi:hypothetical protein
MLQEIMEDEVAKFEKEKRMLEQKLQLSKGY